MMSVFYYRKHIFGSHSQAHLTRLCPLKNCMLSGIGYKITLISYQRKFAMTWRYKKDYGIDKTIEKGRWRYVEYIGPRINILTSEIFSHYPHEFVTVIKYEYHQCKISCKELYKNGWILKPVPQQSCDVCNEVYFFSDGVFYMHPNTCFRFLSHSMTTLYKIEYSFVYDLFQSPYHEMKWLGTSDIFQINNHVIECLSVRQIKHTRYSTVVSVQTIDRTAIKEPAPPSWVTVCHGQCDTPDIVLQWEFELFTYTLHWSDHDVSWIDSESTCQRTGGHLISIHSVKDLDNLRISVSQLKNPHLLYRPFCEGKSCIYLTEN